MSFLTRSKRLILTLSLSAIIPCAQASNDTITLGVSSRVPNVNEDLILKTERVLTDHFGPKNLMTWNPPPALSGRMDLSKSTKEEKFHAKKKNTRKKH